MLGKLFRRPRRSGSGDASQSTADANMLERLNDAQPFNIGAEKWVMRPPQWAIDLFGMQPSNRVTPAEQMRSSAFALGGEEGAAASRGEHHAGRVDDLPGRKLLTAMSEQRRSEVTRNAETERREIVQLLSGIDERKADAAKQTKETEEKLERVQGARGADASLPVVTSRPVVAFISNNGAYLAVLAVLALAEMPTIFTALANTQIEPWASWMLTAALGVVAAFTAHILGEFVYGFLQDLRVWRQRGRSREAEIPVRSGQPGSSAGLRDGPESSAQAVPPSSPVSAVRLGAPESAPVNAADALPELIVKGLVSAALAVLFLVSMFEMYRVRLAVFTKGANDPEAKDTVQALVGDKLSLLLLFLQLVFFTIAFAYSFIRRSSEAERSQRTAAAKKARELDREEKEIVKQRDQKDALESVFITHRESLDNLQKSLDKCEQAELASEVSLLAEILSLHDHAYEQSEHSGPMRGGGS